MKGLSKKLKKSSEEKTPLSKAFEGQKASSELFHYVHTPVLKNECLELLNPFASSEKASEKSAGQKGAKSALAIDISSTDKAGESFDKKVGTDKTDKMGKELGGDKTGIDSISESFGSNVGIDKAGESFGSKGSAGDINGGFGTDKISEEESASGLGEEVWMVDCTLGEGGHSEAFLAKYPALHILGIDADSTIMERAKVRLKPFGGRVKFFNGWSKDFFVNEVATIPKPRVILFDLGVSVFHYTLARRGFSFLEDEALDMRLSPQSQSVSAASIVNETPEKELAALLFKNADERHSRAIARAIVKAREEKSITTAKELCKIVCNALPSALRYGPTNPATKTFMALRIAVNGELEGLKETLHRAFNSLATGGRLGVITFHSKEDAIVKRYFRNLGKSCVCPPNEAKCVCGGRPAAKVLTKKAVKPSDNEVEQNAPSRSAQLRVVEKLHDAISYHLLDG